MLKFRMILVGISLLFLASQFSSCVPIKTISRDVNQGFIQSFPVGNANFYVGQSDQPLNLSDNELSIRIKVFAKTHTDACGKPVSLIAFSDQLDVLTYTLPASLADQYAIKLVNVAVNNTDSYLSIKGRVLARILNAIMKTSETEQNAAKDIFKDQSLEIVDPIGAHENYPNNPYVFYLMTKGNQRGVGNLNLEKELKDWNNPNLKGQLDFQQILQGSTSDKCDPPSSR